MGRDPLHVEQRERADRAQVLHRRDERRPWTRRSPDGTSTPRRTGHRSRGRRARRRARPSCQVSMLCAQPSSWSRAVRRDELLVDPAVRADADRRSRASPPRTQCRCGSRSGGSTRRSDRLTCTPSSGTIPRGSGDHHPSFRRWPTRIGKRPRRYAARSVPGSRSAPIAAISPSPATRGSGRSQTSWAAARPAASHASLAYAVGFSTPGWAGTRRTRRPGRRGTGALRRSRTSARRAPHHRRSGCARASLAGR